MVYDTSVLLMVMRKNHTNNIIFFLCAILVVLLVFLWFNHLKKMENLRAASLVVRESFVQNQPVSTTVASTTLATSSSVGVVVPTSTIEKIEQEKKDRVVKKNLSVPFTTQAPESDWNQPWQDACEEAAIVMLQSFYGGTHLNVSSSKEMILKILERETELGWGGSVEMEKIKQLAEEFVDREFVIIKNPKAEDLREAIINNNPVLVVADGKTLPNPFFKNGGPVYHALVVRGFTDEGFITNDPGTRFGENFFYTTDGLLENIHDWNGGNVSQGEMIILVAK